MRALLAISLVLATTAGTAGATGVTVFLERGGRVVERGDELVTIPGFGGTQRTWTALVGCVREKFAAFDVDVVDEQPGGEYITAVVGGRAEQLGFDGRFVAGIGVTDTVVTRDGIVHVFSRSVGERDARVLCQIAAHEVGHAMGLDHSMQCGDLMSYPRAVCGFGRDEEFLDADAACGEYEDRECHTGSDTQNSFRRLAQLVGLRGRGDSAVKPEIEPQIEPEIEPEVGAGPVEVEPESETHQSCEGRHRRRTGTWTTRRTYVRWIIIRGR